MLGKREKKPPQTGKFGNGEKSLRDPSDWRAQGAKINPRGQTLHPPKGSGFARHSLICFPGERKASLRYFTALLGGKKKKKSLFFGRETQQETPAEFKDELLKFEFLPLQKKTQGKGNLSWGRCWMKQFRESGLTFLSAGDFPEDLRPHFHFQCSQQVKAG